MLHPAPYTVNISSDKAYKMRVYALRINPQGKKRLLYEVGGVGIPFNVRQAEHRKTPYPFPILYKYESFYIAANNISRNQLAVLNNYVTRHNREYNGYFTLIKHYYETEDRLLSNQVVWYEVARLL